MRNICIILTVAGVLAGCASPAPERVSASGYRDKSCGAEARARADDAAINGFETPVVDRVGSDSYRACMAVKAVAGAEPR